MASEIRVNSLTNRSGLSTVTIADTGAVVAGIVTATTFSGPLTGAVTGNVTGDVTGNVTGNLTGNVTGTATTATALSGSPSITVTDITATGNVSIGGTLTYEDVTNIDAVGIITAQSDVIVGRNLSVASGISTVKSLDYAAIDSTISDTAVDVFIYDTSKDSDGGAWRKRTQHTSWYNETLNTSTRGSRKEFPAVAVIVADNSSYHIKIYDGDDPDMPLWMEFQDVASGSGLIPSPSAKPESIAAFNGIIVFGNVAGTVNSGQAGVLKLDFIGDAAYRYMESGSSSYSGKWIGGGLANRNTGTSTSGSWDNTLGFIVDNDVNDVAMTVLPNAPIDDATGLPVPTIAVGTNGGVSIIKDDGTVVDITGSSQGSDAAVDMISFVGNDKIMYSHRYASEINTIVSSDVTAAYYNQTSTWLGRISNSISHDSTTDVSALSSDNNIESIALTETFAASKSVSGLSLANNYAIQNDPDRASCFITTDYNTGWMNGDIKGAFLSDTDTTNLVDTNLVSNGTFDTDTSGWSSAGSITVTQDSGRLKMVSGSGNPHVHTAVTCVVGKRYYFQADFQGEVSFHASSQASSNGDVAYIPYSSYGSSTTRHCFFVATATTMYLVPHVIGTGSTGYVDNVICKLADHDRSVYGSVKATVGGVNGISSGLATYGTITKSAVATGAELIGYGFSSGNHLEQPYNSDLNFGTGDFSVTVWIKPSATGSQQSILNFLSTNSSNVTQDGFYLVHYNGASGNWYFGTYENGAVQYTSLSLGSITSTNKWYCLHVNKIGTTAYLYQDGVFIGSGTVKSDLTINSADQSRTSLVIGKSKTSGLPLTGSLSLVRISSSTPSAEQIKKIYEDERVLFQENAKATLYGSSDAVTALAFDDDTELLHVGTSSGRSDFQGLRRINNTTTAVTTAITAQNEFIIEQ